MNHDSSGMNFDGLQKNASLNHTPARMSGCDFQRLSQLIYDRSGIRIAPAKKVLLEGRIGRRLNQLGIAGYHEYCEYLFSPKGMSEELTSMIDVVATNKTDFFREPWHFEFLRDRALPILQNLYGVGRMRKFNSWSSACSTGEEPFTLAMVLADIAAENPGFQYEILATDISTRAIMLAKEGVYEEERIEPVPMAMRKRYLLKSRDREKRLVKIAPNLRQRILFRRLNLMDENYGIAGLMDVIFCRNVIIYFDRQTQERIIKKICRHLIPGGYLFMGHSETLANMNIDVQYVGASAYQKPLEDNAREI
jgi:chemotaxis protein methyltransferase CheR